MFWIGVVCLLGSLAPGSGSALHAAAGADRMCKVEGRRAFSARGLLMCHKKRHD
jgi:hypothetical protein